MGSEHVGENCERETAPHLRLLARALEIIWHCGRYQVGSQLYAEAERMDRQRIDQTYHKSQMVFLNLGGDYPNQKLSIVIKGKDRDKFKVSPEIAFKDKTICVTGVMSNYKGKPEIVVTDPDQIKVQ